MPNPSQSAVHVNRPLTNISIAFMQDEAGFVADRIFPNIPVQKQSDRYFRYDRSDFARNQFQKRANGTESAGADYKVDSTPTYFCDVWALHKDIDEQIRANADDPLDMDRDATVFLSQQALIAREVTWSAQYFATGIWTGLNTGAGGAWAADVTGVGSAPSTNQVLQWDVANSQPVENVKHYADAIQLLTFRRPNKLVVGRQVWTKLSDHPEIIDRIKYGTSSNTNPAIASRQAVAALMELDEILVMDGIQVTSKENPAFETSVVQAFIGGKNALLIYSNPTPSILQPSGGYTFSWTGYLGGATGKQGQVISKWWEQRIKADRVEAEMAYQQNLISGDCGIFFATIVG